MRMTTLSFIACAALTVGCGATTSSKNIRTAGIVALVDVTSERGEEATVKTELVVGGAGSNTSLILDGGDRLYASRGDERQAMRSVGGDEYEARFSSGGPEFVVSLEREGDDGAPNTRGTLPAPFEITSEFDATPISRVDGAIELTWDPSGEQAMVTIEVDADCLHSFRVEVGGDPGSYTIQPGELTAWKSKKDQPCNAVARVTRTTLGSGDPALDADTIMRLRQVRETTFVSGP